MNSSSPYALIAMVCCGWWLWGALCFGLGRWTKGRRFIIENDNMPRKLADRRPAAPYVSQPK